MGPTGGGWAAWGSVAVCEAVQATRWELSCGEVTVPHWGLILELSRVSSNSLVLQTWGTWGQPCPPLAPGSDLMAYPEGRWVGVAQREGGAGLEALEH